MAPPTHYDRATILETRFDTILPTLAMREDVARPEGRAARRQERMDAEVDAMANRLLLWSSVVMIAVAALTVAAVQYL